ncbi:MAG: sigma 54-interacting transcriptional regulator [Bacteroidota bacterium]
MSRLLELIGEVSKTAAWVLDPDKKLFFATPAFYHILQFSKNHQPLSSFAILRLLFRSLNEQQRYSLAEANRHCMETGEPYSLRFFLPLETDGKWVKMTAQLEKREAGDYLYGVLEDVTAQQQKEDEFKLSQRSNDRAKQIIVWADEAGSVVYANELTLRYLGCELSEAKAKTVFDLFPKYFKSKIWKATLRQLHQGRIVLPPQEGVFIAKNDQALPVEIQPEYVRLFGKDFIFIYAKENSLLKNLQRDLANAQAAVANLCSQLETIDPYQNNPNETAGNGMAEIITKNAGFLSTLAKAKEVAETDATVLLLGETGTGKELLAEAIHRLSPRYQKPLSVVNCATLPPPLIESELFGHEKGAFTGAFQQKKGRFEEANGGTIFLDEIGELPLELQPKLLRVLQDGTFQRIGSNKTLKVNVRIIAATNQDLPTLVNEGRFRRDLFYRLHVFPLILPPLRERRDDIPLLVKHFVKKYNQKSGKDVRAIPQSVLNNLAKRDFPGNVRELENVIEQAVILSKNERLQVEGGSQGVEAKAKAKTLRSFEEMQREFIVEALNLTNWRVSGENGAAKLLNLNPKTLETKMRKLGIRRPGVEN